MADSYRLNPPKDFRQAVLAVSVGEASRWSLLGADLIGDPLADACGRLQGPDLDPAQSLW